MSRVISKKEPELVTVRDSVEAFLSSKPTKPIDRRRFLQAVGALGAALTTYNAVASTLKPKSIVAVTADQFKIGDDQQKKLSNLLEINRVLLKEIDQLNKQFQDLLQFEVEVEWKEEGEPECDADGKNCNETVDNESAEASVTADEILPYALREESFNQLIRKIKQATELFSEVLKADYFDIGTEGVDSTSSNDNQALAHRFKWKKEDVGIIRQALLTLGVGGAGITAFMFYDKLAKKFQQRFLENPKNLNKDEIQIKAEQKTTRRSFFQILAGWGIFTWLGVNQSVYDERSDHIIDAGKQNILSSIHRIMFLSEEEIFSDLTEFSYDQFYQQLKSLVGELKPISETTIRSFFEQGIRKIKDKKDDLLNDIPMDGYDKDFSFSEDEVDEKKVAKLFSQVERARNQIEAQLDVMHTLMRGQGLPNNLKSAFRGYAITQKIEEHISDEQASHMWGLSKDLLMMYGTALGVLLLSDGAAALKPGLDENVYNPFNTICNALDRKRMGAINFVQSALSKISSDVKKKIIFDRDLNRLVRIRLKELTSQVESLISSDLIHVDPLQVNEKTITKIEKEITRIRSSNVVEHYLKIALAIHARKKLKNLETITAILQGRSERDLIDLPSENELKECLEHLISKTDGSFTLELLDSGLLDDRHNEEDHLTTESIQLESSLEGWARRIHTRIHLVSTQMATLNEGVDSTLQQLLKLNAADILTSFSKSVTSDLNGNADKLMKSFEDEIKAFDKKRGVHRFMDRPELYKRFTLKKMATAYRQHNDFFILKNNLSRTLRH